MHPVRLASGAAASKSAAARVTGTCNDGATTMVPQPTPAHLGAAGLKQLPLAPDMKRVDLVAPPFSNPTNVAGRAHQAVAWRRPRLPRRPSKRWRRSSATVARMTAAWRAHRAGGAPPRLVAPTSRALKALARAVKARHPGRARNAALTFAKRPSTSSCVTGLPPRSIDARFDLWTRPLRVDATAGNVPAVNGDIATLEWIRDRTARTLDSVAVTRMDTHLEELRSSVADEDLAPASKTAAALERVLASAAQRVAP